MVVYHFNDNYYQTSCIDKTILKLKLSQIVVSLSVPLHLLFQPGTINSSMLEPSDHNTVEYLYGQVSGSHD